METDPGKAAACLGPLTTHVESFLTDLPEAGYARPAVAARRWIIHAFVRWIDAKHLRVEHLHETDLLAFLERRRGGVDSKERPTLHKFLAHLRARGVCAPVPASPVTPAEGGPAAIPQRPAKATEKCM